MLIYTFVFGVVFGATAPIGEPSGLNVYALYLLCGILPWGFFSQVTNLGMNALLSNASLVRKVAFARETLVISQVIFCVVQWSIEMSLLAVVLIIAGSPILPWLPVTILLMVCLAVYAAGFALALSAAAVFFRDLRYLWSILLQVMFFATPIIYMPDRLDGKLPAAIDFILTWNPMAVFILSFRHMLYGGAAPNWWEMLYLVAVSVGVFIAGWAIFARLSRRVAEEL
jgi:ABC-type polysaccharide/polyol phosphate export permease